MNIHKLIAAEIALLKKIHEHPRPWHWGIMMAVAICFPVAIGAYTAQLSLGLSASFGSMVILNLPNKGTPFFRMTRMFTCAFGLVTCFSLGLIAYHIPWLTVPLLWFISFWVLLFSFYHELEPPAGLFIILATAVALFIPAEFSQIPSMVGLVMLGSITACLVGGCYSLIFANGEVEAPTNTGYVNDMIINSFILSFFVALSLFIALSLDMQRPYWAPLSCFIVIMGVNMRSIWTKNIHRLVGTLLGLIIVFAILSIKMHAWGVVLTLFVLVLFIENFIVRNYIIASAFITVLTILLAESGSSDSPLHVLIQARFWDTVIGCLVGLFGGMVMHNEKLRPTFHRCEVLTVRLLEAYAKN